MIINYGYGGRYQQKKSVLECKIAWKQCFYKQKAFYSFIVTVNHSLVAKNDGA
jgi:hypothetical protein